MYSPLIIDQNVTKVSKALKVKFKRHAPDLSRERAGVLQTKFENKVEFTADEREFIRNEQVLCKLDCEYFFRRYCLINLDAIEGGGAGPLAFWEPQQMLHDKLAQAEEECHEQKASGDPVDGIRLVCNKARQVGFTMVWRGYTLHRMVFHDYTRGMAASLNADLIHEVYFRDKMIYDNLPFFLKPEIEFDVKDQNISLLNHSRLIYQESSQKGAMGISRQFEVGHLTEVSQWDHIGTNRITLDLMPAIPYSINTLFGMEAVPAGRGNFWHRFTEDVRTGKHPQWRYIFIPWYSEPKKYRRAAPLDWKPSTEAIDHARKVAQTSHLYTRWANYMIPKNNLFFWETERESYRRNGDLNYFLTNFPATPQESFQHSGRSAFPAEFLERARNNAMEGVPYDVMLKGTPQSNLDVVATGE